mmetsp:Transcript_14725/g.27281  ORF Transcript_14725/g.27281 Transcript_14725/m.27281 type:complete len:174 (-) Transcript_14725:98-619(-)
MIWLLIASLASAADPKADKMLACVDVVRLKLEEVESEVDIFLYETEFDKQEVVDKLAAEMLVLCYDYISDDLASEILDDQGFELTEDLRAEVKLRTEPFKSSSELILDEQEQEIYDTVIRDLPDMEEHKDSDTPVEYLKWLLIVPSAVVCILLLLKYKKVSIRRLLNRQKRSK